jgi:hypothetical protein
MKSGTEERGFALAVSIFALVIIAALITAVFFAARQEMKIGENSLTAQRAFSAADAGVNNAIANWNMSWNNLATNGTATFSGSLPSGTGSWSGTVHRLNPQLFFVQVTGTDKNNLSTRTLGALSRLLIMQMQMKGAITTQGSMKIGGSSFINGVDTNPAGWFVTKAYATRVGSGPFPTEDTGESGEFLRRVGGERGATTGRPRRCGWLDLVLLRYVARLNGLTSLAITKVDVLGGLEEVPVCAAPITGRLVDAVKMRQREELHCFRSYFRDLLRGLAIPDERFVAHEFDVNCMAEFVEQHPYLLGGVRVDHDKARAGKRQQKLP